MEFVTMQCFSCRRKCCRLLLN